MKRKAIEGVFDLDRPHLRSCSESHGSASKSSEEEKIDILSASMFGENKYLIRSNNEQVPVESLRGKLIGLLLVQLSSSSIKLPPYLIDIYNDFNSHTNLFEIVYVLIPPAPTRSRSFPPPMQSLIQNRHLAFFTDHVSSFPWLSIPFADHAWRSHLSSFYTTQPRLSVQLPVIDPATRTIVHPCALQNLRKFGPSIFPFTYDRQLQLINHFQDLCKETSLTTLLSSVSNQGFLLDRNLQKVPISHLQGKDVALYCCDGKSAHALSFRKQLEDIYNQYKHRGFEIVFINFRHHRGYKDEISFNNAVRDMPWLAFPFRDDNYWSLLYILDGQCSFLLQPEWRHYPTLFIRAKDEAFLDPYGYPVINKYGTHTYPFTRRAALKSEMLRLKQQLYFDSFVKEAGLLGLDLSALIRMNKAGERENVSLSSLNLNAKGVLVVFARLSNDTEKALASLMDSYARQEEPFSFEVIFVSFDRDSQSFYSHFSGMPWLAYCKQIEQIQFSSLMERTTKFEFIAFDHCMIAFGPSGELMRIGELPESFEKREFPFLKDVEYINAMAWCMNGDNGWLWDLNEAFAAEDNTDWLES